MEHKACVKLLYSFITVTLQTTFFEIFFAEKGILSLANPATVKLKCQQKWRLWVILTIILHVVLRQMTCREGLSVCVCVCVRDKQHSCYISIQLAVVAHANQYWGQNLRTHTHTPFLLHTLPFEDTKRSWAAYDNQITENPCQPGFCVFVQWSYLHAKVDSTLHQGH